MAPPTDARACRLLPLLLPPLLSTFTQKITMTAAAATKTPTTENRRLRKALTECNCNCNFRLRLVFWTFAYFLPPPTVRTLPVARCTLLLLLSFCTHFFVDFFSCTQNSVLTLFTHTHTRINAHANKRDHEPHKSKSTLALSFNDWKRNEQKHCLKRHNALSRDSEQQLITKSAAKCV